jgi:hypothetical protein
MTNRFTVGDLKRLLAVHSDNDELSFPGGLTFYRLKMRDTDLVTVEFNEIEAELSANFQKKFPAVRVAFCSFESDGSVMQEIRVPTL